MPGDRPTDHSIPTSLARISTWLEEDQLAPGGDPVGATVRGLVALLRLECAHRADALKAWHAATLEAGADPNSDAYKRLVTELHQLLARANYREISQEELREAFDSQALSAVQIDVDLAAFASLHIFARGKSRRAEEIRLLFGLRRRRVEFDVLERVFVFSSMGVGARRPVSAPGSRASARGQAGGGAASHAEPLDGAAQASLLNLKLFRSIPVPDLEMLLPNCKVKMRRIDQAAVFVPAVVSVALAASKVIFSITAIIGLIQFWMGLSKESPVVSGGWGLVAAGSFTLLGITMGAWTKYQKRRLEYANSHSQTLYFQTLDSEAGAFLRVLDEAFEEEAKEAALAYAFLAARGPANERELDERIESWLRQRIGVEVDFEVDDALAKLERLGVATRSGQTWAAVPASEAASLLRERWRAAAV